jgi:hypothetical protein
MAKVEMMIEMMIAKMNIAKSEVVEKWGKIEEKGKCEILGDELEKSARA